MAADLDARLAIAAEWIARSSRVVVFTGAGISTDSGIPDFRGPDGAWTRRDKGLPPPKWKVAPDEVQPNAGHRAIVALQELGKLSLLISQNVDNLHLRSGIEPARIAELHGNSELLKCLDCDRRRSREEAGWDERRFGRGYRTSRPVEGQPRCACGGRLISSVVNFGDPMPEREMDLAAERTAASDLFMAVGSSLLVSPANSFPKLAAKAGVRLVLVNREPTPLDPLANLLFHEGIAEVLPAMVQRARALAKAP